MTTRIYIYPMMITGTMVQYTTRPADMTTVKIAKPEEFESLVHVDNGKFMAIVASGFESKHQAQSQPALTGLPVKPTPTAKNESGGTMWFKDGDASPKVSVVSLDIGQSYTIDPASQPALYSKESERLLNEIAALRIDLREYMTDEKINQAVSVALKSKLGVLGRTEFSMIEHELQERVKILRTLLHYAKEGKEVTAHDMQAMMKTAHVRTDGVDFNTLNQPSPHPLYGIDAGKAS